MALLKRLRSCPVSATSNHSCRVERNNCLAIVPQLGEDCFAMLPKRGWGFADGGGCFRELDWRTHHVDWADGWMVQFGDHSARLEARIGQDFCDITDRST